VLYGIKDDAQGTSISSLKGL